MAVCGVKTYRIAYLNVKDAVEYPDPAVVRRLRSSASSVHTCSLAYSKRGDLMPQSGYLIDDDFNNYYPFVLI